MEEINCKKCGKIISSEFPHCPYCRESLSKEKQDRANYFSLCRHCGRGLRRIWITCPYCNGILDSISYEKYKHMESKNPEAVESNRKGNEYLESRDAANAIKCYERAIELDPSYTVAWRSKGISLLNIGRDSEALSCFERATELNPKDAHAWWNKGVALQELGRDTLANECLDKAKQLGYKE